MVFAARCSCGAVMRSRLSFASATTRAAQGPDLDCDIVDQSGCPDPRREQKAKWPAIHLGDGCQARGIPQLQIIHLETRASDDFPRLREDGARMQAAL